MTKKNGGRPRRAYPPPGAWHLLAQLVAETAYHSSGDRQPVWYSGGDDFVILEHNYPPAVSSSARDQETARLRRRLADAGIGVLGYATYPSPGEDGARYSYAMLLDAGKDQLGLVLDLYVEDRTRTWRN
jgi:hypothetical protein